MKILYFSLISLLFFSYSQVEDLRVYNRDRKVD